MANRESIVRTLKPML
ncbi:unnamed protein product [Medioppia subpectinata]|uniref:Uncharacterized protein n=1 Tax=Medioppia subpectinata TaxID=1979941 RepID=A0A7R9QLW6_9ACAR|nr:unnamed protein product [Medioppia subpectinata]CAG2123059.1 unnamed protein product [Medioppia subpectinata]